MPLRSWASAPGADTDAKASDSAEARHMAPVALACAREDYLRMPWFFLLQQHLILFEWTPRRAARHRIGALLSLEIVSQWMDTQAANVVDEWLISPTLHPVGTSGILCAGVIASKSCDGTLPGV